MKVLITGDREWEYLEPIFAVLSLLPQYTIIVHGACRGADNAAAAIAEMLGLTANPYPADWSGHGRSAGPIRNRLMVMKEHLKGDPIDLVVAFHDDLQKSRDTRDMVSVAQKAGIPWVQVLSPEALNNWFEREYGVSDGSKVPTL